MGDRIIHVTEDPNRALDILIALEKSNKPLPGFGLKEYRLAVVINQRE